MRRRTSGRSRSSASAGSAGWPRACGSTASSASCAAAARRGGSRSRSSSCSSSLSPLVEVGGPRVMAVALAMGMMTGMNLLAFMLAAFALGLMLSTTSLLLEELSFHTYPKARHLLVLVPGVGRRELRLSPGDVRLAAAGALGVADRRQDRLGRHEAQGHLAAVNGPRQGLNTPSRNPGSGAPPSAPTAGMTTILSSARPSPFASVTPEGPPG